MNLVFLFYFGLRGFCFNCFSDISIVCLKDAPTGGKCVPLKSRDEQSARATLLKKGVASGTGDSMGVGGMDAAVKPTGTYSRRPVEQAAWPGGALESGRRVKPAQEGLRKGFMVAGTDRSLRPG
jgi:hypothetical protein